jgi:thymidylate kinase
MVDPSGARRPVLVSFSGIDGAGKSTQIENLHRHLSTAGFQVQRLAFWDDVAVLRRFREYSRSALLKGDAGIGSPGNPVNRRDKNVQTWYMNTFRFFLYSLDAAWLNLVVRKALRSHTGVVIFDRYLYDELANLPLRSRFTRSYIRLMLKFAPQPNVAYLLDADPVQARERKPEYPLDFVQSNRAAYLALSELSGSMTVIAPGTADEVASRVIQEIEQNLCESETLVRRR